ncbi:hypothetical protein ACFPRL_21790 [Pseudoclavibacter helvolus]
MTFDQRLTRTASTSPGVRRSLAVLVARRTSRCTEASRSCSSFRGAGASRSPRSAASSACRCRLCTAT